MCYATSIEIRLHYLKLGVMLTATDFFCACFCRLRFFAKLRFFCRIVSKQTSLSRELLDIFRCKKSLHSARSGLKKLTRGEIQSLNTRWRIIVNTYIVKILQFRSLYLCLL